MLKLKRAYEPATSSDGHRILVDRLWPRGMSKRRAAIDEWIKDVAPSTDARPLGGRDRLLPKLPREGHQPRTPAAYRRKAASFRRPHSARLLLRGRESSPDLRLCARADRRQNARRLVSP